MRVVSRVLVVPAPFITRRSQLVSSEGAGTRGEATGDDNGPLTIPRRVLCHDFSMSGDILWRELWQLVRLCVYPS